MHWSIYVLKTIGSIGVIKLIEFAKWVAKWLGIDLPDFLLIHVPTKKLLVMGRKGWVWIDPNKHWVEKPRVILGAHPNMVIFDDMVKNNN